MAMQFKKKKKGTSVRLTGLFKTKRRGLFVGSVTELDDMKSKIKQAIADEKGLVFFLWRNDPEEEGPAYTLSMDVSQDEDRPKKKQRPEPEDEDEDDDDDEEKDEDDVPF